MTDNDPTKDWEFDDPTPAGSYAKWTEPGETVVGRIASFSLDGGTTYDGEPCPLLVLETTTGVVKITGSYAVLRREMQEKAVRLVPGYGASVTYVKEETSAKLNKPYKVFLVNYTRGPVAPFVMPDDAAEAPFVMLAGEWWPQVGVGSYPDRMLP